jgi:hypothetical protein
MQPQIIDFDYLGLVCAEGDEILSRELQCDEDALGKGRVAMAGALLRWVYTLQQLV